MKKLALITLILLLATPLFPKDIKLEFEPANSIYCTIDDLHCCLTIDFIKISRIHIGIDAGFGIISAFNNSMVDDWLVGISGRTRIAKDVFIGGGYDFIQKNIYLGITMRF